MDTCAWCNKSVADDKTIWVRKNLLIGYPFCSNRCKTEWKNSKEESKPESTTNVDSFNESQEESQAEPSCDYDISSLTNPKHFSDFKSELRYYEELQNRLSGKHHSDKVNQENIETAIKTMAIVRKLLPHWKIIIPITLITLGVIYYLSPLYGQVSIFFLISFIAFIIWAYFTEPKK